jgi:predicted Fe-S protein YdhL (DUF1289 family)
MQICPRKFSRPNKFLQNFLSGAMYSIKIALGNSRQAAPPAPAMLTPCIGVCEVNELNVCSGCHRTLSEIGAWSSMSDAARSQIMARLDQREVG